jgi:molybdate transport system substrate-binding protein
MKFFITIIFSFSMMFAAQKTLFFYCGITMAKAMSEIKQKIEKKDNCKIKIIPGGSKSLYNSLKAARVGDLYLPGSDSYRNKNLKDGLLTDFVNIGYNQAALVVLKGNPKHIKSLKDLKRKDIRLVIGNPETGSVGRVAKKVAIIYGGENYYNYLYNNSVKLLADSKRIDNFLINKKADVAIDWRAAAINNPYLDVIKIDEKYAKKYKLQINLLKFSKHKKIAKDLMNFAASKEGQKIMKKYGFR